jgi:hypothetical protein
MEMSMTGITPDKSAYMQLVFEEFSGGGVVIVGGQVTLAIRTDKIGIDLDMTVDQAKSLASKLNAALK